MSRQRIVAGNWKMNGSLDANANLLAEIKAALPELPSVEVVVFPPSPYLAQVQESCAGSFVKWGAQDLSRFGAGAYTGDVSASMLSDFGCQYVLVGHSERRALFGDSDAVVAEKFLSAVRAGLMPVLCVGESLAEREAGLSEQTVSRQLSAVMDVCDLKEFDGCVVAYEPVWAIGTGKTPSPDEVQSIHAAIRQRVAAKSAAMANGLRILYGGSVKAENASSLFAMPDVDGGLVGGASLVASDFLPIVRSAM